MAGMRSRKRLRCRAGNRVATKHSTVGLTVKSARYYRWKRDEVVIRCPVCNSDDILDYEATYIKTHKKEDNCYCHGVPHPHRKSKHRLCIKHPMKDIPLTEDEERDAEEVLKNPNRTSFR